MTYQQRRGRLNEALSIITVAAINDAGVECNTKANIMAVSYGALVGAVCSNNMIGDEIIAYLEDLAGRVPVQN